MIFLEDNRRKSKYSIYLDNVYVRENVRFAMGSGNLKKVINSSIKDKICKEIFVYVDVVPDNINTIDALLDLLSSFCQYSNVFIIPIFCSEYVVLRYLDSINALNKIYHCIINLETNPKELYEFSNCVNFEKVCKQILYSVRDKYEFILKSITIQDSVKFVLEYQYFKDSNIIKNYYETRKTNSRECISAFIKDFKVLSNLMNISLNKCSSLMDIEKYISRKG